MNGVGDAQDQAARTADRGRWEALCNAGDERGGDTRLGARSGPQDEPVDAGWVVL